MSVRCGSGFIWGTALVSGAAALTGHGQFGAPLPVAVVGGLAAGLTHWVVTMVHHAGHALAARSTGYPMSGVRLGRYLIFARSLYPKDEPELPAAVHIRRALGGPLASLTFGAVLGAAAFAVGQEGRMLFWLLLFGALDSFLVFGLGVFLPLGFTDGSTLLHWWRG